MFSVSTPDVSLKMQNLCQPKFTDWFLFTSLTPLSPPKKITRTENEFFFVDPDAKLSKVAPEGWKEDPKKRKSDVPFNLFLRIKFFLDDVNFIQ